SQELVAEGLLARAGNARAQPVAIGHRLRIDDVDIAGIGDDGSRHAMRYRVERPKPLVDRDFENGRRGIERAVDRARAPAVPAAADAIGPFAAIPGRGWMAWSSRQATSSLPPSAIGRKVMRRRRIPDGRGDPRPVPR